MTRRAALPLLALLFALPAGSRYAVGEPADAAEKAYRRLAAEFDESAAAFSAALAKASTPQERQKAVDDLRPRPERFAPRFLALARKDPKSPAAVDCLAWVVTHPAPPDSPQAGLRAEALDLLAADYAADKRLGRLCTQLVYAIDRPAVKFLRAVLANGSTRGVRARACASLGHNLKFRARLIRTLKEDDALRQELERTWGAAAVARLRKADPDALLAEARRRFEEVRDRYGELRHPLHGTLADLAKWHLLSIQNPVAVDRPSPSTVGTDLDGKRMRLREFDGKVVLVDFWASHFPSCRRMFDFERKLVARMEGRPFALIGVNADGSKGAARKAVEAEKITWRSWYDGGGTGGPIATRWEVDAWPTVVLIDHKGVVRSIYEGWPEPKAIAAEVEGLVKEAEKAR